MHDSGFWLAHLNYVAFWVLLSLALLLLSLRLVAQQLVLRRSSMMLPDAGRWPPAALAAALVPAALGSGYVAVRPDPTFYGAVAGAAFEAGDCRTAVVYYAPLADWGSRDEVVLTRLATCELQLGRLESGLRHLLRARSVPGGDGPAQRATAARTLEALGRPAEAAEELEAALRMMAPGAQRDQLALEVARLRRDAGPPRQ